MSRTTRYALIAAAALLVVIGLTAVVAVLRGSFGAFEARVISTASILLAAAAVGALGAHARSSGAAVRLGLVTAGLAALAALLAIVLVWMPDDTAPDTLAKAMLVTAAAAVAAGLHSALRTWADEPVLLVRAIVAVGYLAAADVAWLVVSERGASLLGRFLAAAAILVALGIVLLPILGRLRSDRERRHPSAHV